MVGERGPWPEGMDAQSLKAEFPGLFAPTVGTAQVAPYEIELTDVVPVRSPRYRCAPPKLVIFRVIVYTFLEQWGG
jgi:hypothetical protein